MRVMHRRISSATAILLVATLLGATAPGAGIAAEDRNGPVRDTALAAIPPGTPPAISPGPERAGALAIRTIEIDEFTGSEPDPEAFDQRGLDIWWQRHQQTLQKAE